MLPFLFFVAVQASPAVSIETEELGQRLARTSGIVSMAPMLIDKDLADLSKEIPNSSAEDRLRLTELGHEEGKRGVSRLISALGHAYASRLTLSDLRILVTQNESLPAAHRRSAEPAAIMETMQALGEMDLKKNVAALFCKETGKLCHR